MNVDVWDVPEDIVALVKAGCSGKAVALDRLAIPHVPLKDVVPQA